MGDSRPASRRPNLIEAGRDWAATMAAMRRWSSNLLCGLSLLIFLLAMGIWVRSYFIQEMIVRFHSRSDPQRPAVNGSLLVGIACSHGAVALVRNRDNGWGHGNSDTKWSYE